MKKTYIDLVIRYRWLVLLTSIVMVMGFSFGAQYLSVNSNYRIFFDGENKQLKAFDEIQKNFSQSDNLLFVVAPKSGNVFTPKVLSAIKEITEEAWKLPLAGRVDSIVNYQHTYTEGDELIVADLIEDPSSLSAEQIASIREIATNEVVLRDRLISGAGSVTGINVTIHMPNNAQSKLKDMVAQARALKTAMMNKYEDIDIHLTGVVMMNNAFSESSKKDMGSLLPLMLLIAAILIGIFLRSITGSFATLVVILLTVLSSMGFMGWNGWMISGPSSAAPTIVFTMAVADCIHIFISFFFSMRMGLNKDDAIKRSVDLNFFPIMITSITTAIGFLSLNFSASPPYHDLGNVVAFGVMLAFVFSISFLPALISVLPVKIPDKDSGDQSSVMGRLANFVIAKRKRVLMGSVLITVLLALAIPLNSIDDQFLKYFSEDVEFRRASDFTNENLTGIYNIEYSLDTEVEGGVNQPEFLVQTETFVAWLRMQPEVVHVYSFTDTLKNINQQLNGGDISRYQLPDDRELSTQYMLLYELSLPYGLDVNTLVNFDKSAYRIFIALKSVSSKTMLELEQRFNNYLATNTNGFNFSGASPNLIFAHIGLNNSYSMLVGMALAIALITFILIFAFRSFSYGCMSILPNLIPALIAFGIWGLFSGEVGISIASALGLTIGIVVDDTVHFVSKYLTLRRKEGLMPEAAIKQTFEHVGTALCVTSFVLIAGFLVFTTSSYSMNSDLGYFVAMTIGFALLIDLFFLAPLILLVEEYKTKNNSSEVYLDSSQSINNN